MKDQLEQYAKALRVVYRYQFFNIKYLNNGSPIDYEIRVLQAIAATRHNLNLNKNKYDTTN